MLTPSSLISMAFLTCFCQSEVEAPEAERILEVEVRLLAEAFSVVWVEGEVQGEALEEIAGEACLEEVTADEEEVLLGAVEVGLEGIRVSLLCTMFFDCVSICMTEVLVTHVSFRLIIHIICHKLDSLMTETYIISSRDNTSLELLYEGIIQSQYGPPNSGRRLQPLA